MATTELSPSPKLHDIYKEHKVVAMPFNTFVGKTVQEMVSAQNNLATPTDNNNNNNDPMHRRSLSAGRAPMRGRDILKETYDRMGIATPRQHPWDEALVGIQSTVSPVTSPTFKATSSPTENNARRREAAASPFPFRSNGGGGSGKDVNLERSDSLSAYPQQRDRPQIFQKRFVSAAVLSRGRNDTREDDRKSHEDEPRSRSLSRGRYKDWKWPPKKENDAEVDQEEPQTRDMSDVKTNGSASLKTVGSSQSSPSSQTQREVRPSQGFLPSSPSSWTRRNSHSPAPSSPSIQDEKKEADDGSCSSPKKEFTPIKDRISALAARRHRNTQQNQPQRPNGLKSVHPPVIDIYEESKKYEEANVNSSLPGNKSTAENVDAGQSTKEQLLPPSPAAAAAANAAADLFRSASKEPANRSSLPTGRPLKIGGVANAFLAAIQTPRSLPEIQRSPSNVTAPFMEIPSNEDSPGGVDTSSVAMSSVSGDELSVSVKSRNMKWSERNKPVATPPGRKTSPIPSGVQPSAGQQMTCGLPATNGVNKTISCSGSSQTQVNISMEAIERMIDERVQARLAEMEARSGNLLRQLERRMEDKNRSKMDLLEAKIEHLTNVLSRLWSEQQPPHAESE